MRSTNVTHNMYIYIVIHTHFYQLTGHASPVKVIGKEELKVILSLLSIFFDLKNPKGHSSDCISLPLAGSACPVRRRQIVNILSHRVVHGGIV